MKKKIAVVLGASLAVLLGCVITLLACGDMGGISGTVTSSFSGQPLNTNWEAWVSLWTENYSWYSQDNLSDEDWADGKYSYSNLSPDDYTVSASSYGYQSQSQDVTLSAGSSAVVNFALDPIVASIAADVVALDTVNGTETGGWRTVKVDVKYQEMCHDPRRLMVWVVGATSGTTVIYDSGENSYLDLWNCRDTSITNNPTWSGYDTVYHLAFYWDTTYFANEGYTIMAALQTNDPHGDGIDINPDPAATTWVHQAGAFPTGPTDPGTAGGSTVSVTVTNAVITAYKATSSPLPGHDQDAFLYDPNGASALSNPTFEVTVDYWESLPMEIVVWLAATAWGDTRPMPEWDPFAPLEVTGPGTYTVTWDGTNPGYEWWTGEWGTWSFDVDLYVSDDSNSYVIDHFYAKTHDGQSVYYDVLVSSNHDVWWYCDETATPPGYQFRCNYVLNGGSSVAPSQVDLITLDSLTVMSTQTGPTALATLHDDIQSYPSTPTLTEDDTYGIWRTVFTGQTASGSEHRRDHKNPRILATNKTFTKTTPKIPLGGSAKLRPKVVGQVYVPTTYGGTLKLTGSTSIRLFYTTGSLLTPDQAAIIYKNRAETVNENRIEPEADGSFRIPRDKYKWYYVTIDDTSKTKVTAEFEIEALSEKSPWQVSYYPISKEVVEKHLYDSGGIDDPLDKFDQEYSTGCLALALRPLFLGGVRFEKSTLLEQDAERTVGWDFNNADGNNNPYDGWDANVPRDFFNSQNVSFGQDGDTNDEIDVSWWGFCDARAAAIIACTEPTHTYTSLKGVTFTPTAKKGLLVALYSFQNMATETPLDVVPHLWHSYIEEYLNGSKLMFGADMYNEGDGPDALWNYPVYYVKASYIQKPHQDDEKVLKVKSTVWYFTTTGKVTRDLDYYVTYDANGGPAASVAADWITALADRPDGAWRPKAYKDVTFSNRWNQKLDKAKLEEVLDNDTTP